ncbi:sensor histidine kinase [Streptococcus iniae]|uniref:sensor histidine kinase n=1 Tax=Streptococcus iniae TaxID=1346 RepID=UPI000EF67559|nr:sensor histidine kinase [Streptococcus iniae]RLV45755.1 sensor histidine kinase [Streptococcus iniae]
MKKILIHTLLKSYSYLVITIIIFFASVLSYINWEHYNQSIESSQQLVLENVKNELDGYSEQVKGQIFDISQDKDKIEGINRYFQMSPSEYEAWLLHHPLFLVKNVSFHNTIRSLYRNLPFVTGVDLAMANEKRVLVSTDEFKSGYLISSKDYKAPVNSFPINLYDASSLTLLGTFYIRVDDGILEKIIDQSTRLPVAVSIKNTLNRQFYKRKSIGQKDRLAYQYSGDLLIEVGLSKNYILKEVGRLTALIYLVSAILIGILLLVLRRVFHHYQVQVTDLVDTMQLITDQDNSIRINTDNKQQEMYLISSQINDMLDSLDHSIRDIYRLELAQQDANMRALQSQINPHFLYNTLEFFRMYSVTKEMDDLADMLYEFSSLLRGSISQKKETTLQEELAFCEKHSYICQIRYPRSIAYSYQIEKGCEDIKIPRFSIQPLVENYFIHGVDLKRMDNAISVKVSRQGNAVEILIRDNGKGMTKDTLSACEELLGQRQVLNQEQLKSIGIVNVHERLLLYFGDRYQISLHSTEAIGVTYSISITGVFSEED